jgi:hypothetical protein
MLRLLLAHAPDDATGGEIRSNRARPLSDCRVHPQLSAFRKWFGTIMYSVRSTEPRLIRGFCHSQVSRYPCLVLRITANKNQRQQESSSARITVNKNHRQQESPATRITGNKTLRAPLGSVCCTRIMSDWIMFDVEYNTTRIG